MDYSSGESNAYTESTIPLVNNPKHPIENLGFGIYSSLMGTFDFPTPIARINAISSSKAPSQRDFFKTHYFSDPWPLPSSTTILDGEHVGGMEFPISVAEISYQSIVNTVDFNPTPFSREELDGDVAPP